MKVFSLFILFVTLATMSYAQVPVKPSAPPQVTTANGDTLKVVQILSTQRYGYKKLDSLTELILLVGKVVLKQENTTFYADSAVLNKNAKIVEAFKNVHINDNDSIHTYSDYLLYHTDTKIAFLNKNVRLTDGKSNLFTEELEYDVNQKIGIYRKGGKVINGTSTLTSNEGTYYADIKDVYFKQDVRLVDPQYKLNTDSLLYNTASEIATFISKTYIEDSAKRTIVTSEGFYDLKNKNASFGARPVIKDGATTTIANQVDTDDSTGISILTGNAIFKDTAQGLSVLANRIVVNKASGQLLATQKPLMIIKQENDSTFITADTLYSGRLSELEINTDSTAKDSVVMARLDSAQTTTAKKENDSADRYFRGYHHVKIFSDSMQAVCDSLFYSGKDSVFRLFKDPIVWSGESQVTGDTIYLTTKNKKPEEMHVFERGFMVNRTANDMYNQIKGNRIFGYFTDGEIDHVRAKGSAESIYYAKDSEEKLVGINKANSDIIDMRFKNKELNKVVFISEVTGRMIPIRQAGEQDKLLRGFKWQDERRPKSKFELFGN